MKKALITIITLSLMLIITGCITQQPRYEAPPQIHHQDLQGLNCFTDDELEELLAVRTDENLFQIGNPIDEPDPEPELTQYNVLNLDILGNPDFSLVMLRYAADRNENLLPMFSFINRHNVDPYGYNVTSERYGITIRNSLSEATRGGRRNLVNEMTEMTEDRAYRLVQRNDIRYVVVSDIFGIYENSDRAFSMIQYESLVNNTWYSMILVLHKVNYDGNVIFTEVLFDNYFAEENSLEVFIGLMSLLEIEIL